MGGEDGVPGDDILDGHFVEHLPGGVRAVELGVEVGEGGLGVNVGAEAELVELGVDGSGEGAGGEAGACLESCGGSEGVGAVAGAQHAGEDVDGVAEAAELGGGPDRAGP